MMKRRWSNNGGFSLRMLEESSSEVTSSSAALVMSPGMAMSPTSLGSPDEYSELDMWGYDDSTPYNNVNGVITNGNGNSNTSSSLVGLCNNNGLGGVPNGSISIAAMQLQQQQLQQQQQQQQNNPQLPTQQLPPHTIINPQNNRMMTPLPSLMQNNTLMHTPRSESVNSISSGNFYKDICLYLLHYTRKKIYLSQC